MCVVIPGKKQFSSKGESMGRMGIIWGFDACQSCPELFFSLRLSVRAELAAHHMIGALAGAGQLTCTYKHVYGGLLDVLWSPGAFIDK